MDGLRTSKRFPLGSPTFKPKIKAATLERVVALGAVMTVYPYGWGENPPQPNLRREAAAERGAAVLGREPRARYHDVDMTAAVAGVVHGKVIELDEAVPELEGRRVRVIVEPAEDTADRAEQERAWEEWVARGPQGPVEDDGEPELP